MKPYILMPMAEINQDQGLARTYAMRRTYADLVVAHGYVPVGVPTDVSFAAIEGLYREAAAILLMGGTDIQPYLYHEGAAGAQEPFDAARDNLEWALVRRAAVDKKPLIGICRGSQMMAVALGGALHQEIAPMAGGEAHAPEVHRYETTLTKPDQTIALDPASRLAQLLGRSEVHGPCNHHQAIKEVPEELVAVGHSPAGIIEAVEARDPDWFCFGLQCHPEMRAGGDFSALFDFARPAAANHANKKDPA